MRWNVWAWWAIAAIATVSLGASSLKPHAPPRLAAPSRPPSTNGARPEPPPRVELGLRSAAPVALTPAPLLRSASLATRPRSMDPPTLRLEAPPPAPSSSAAPPIEVAVAVVNQTPGAPRAPRKVSLAALAAWSKPGLCASADEAAATREKLTASFRAVDAAEQGQLYLDPRLPEGAEAAVVTLLVRAQTEVERSLELSPAAPTTYVYFDQQLMKAAACINEDVVAFYDGALHLVVNRSDIQQSVTHEYTHHALFSSDLSGPGWAQEGIAMSVARETWWQTPARLQALIQMPFSAEQMATQIPYKLPSDQAVAFYVQSALTVQCLLRARGWSLQQLAEVLRGGSSADSISYDPPELEDGAFVSSCVAQLSRG